MGVKFKAGIIILFMTALLLSLANVYAADSFTWYTVKSGDRLYTVSGTFGTSIDDIKALNGLASDTVYVGQALKVKINYVTYAVRSGDTLWIISQRFGTTVDKLIQMNALASTSLTIGQKLMLPPSAAYVVKSGDTLWIIANKFGITISSLRDANSLTTDNLNIGQILAIPKPVVTAASTSAPTPSPAQYQTQLQPVATVFYTVQAGDTANAIAKKYNMSAADIMKYNYMADSDWFNAGQIIAINGYAVRTYTVRPGEASAPARVGKLVDWFTEGQYIIKRGDVFTITDVDTGANFKVKMMGGYNHSDIEALTADDTAVMLKLFGGSWQWSPRAVVIFKDGMNIAASLSGMPHSFDTLPDNNMSGHCDLYLLNSKPHGTGVDVNYVELHRQMVLKAAGK